MKTCPKFPSSALLFLIIIPAIHAVGNQILQEEQAILEHILDPSGYDRRIRPSEVNDTGYGPTVVRVNTLIRSIENIDVINQEFRLQLTFRQQWTDRRLVFDDLGGKIKYLSLTETNQVWKPDTFFKNEKNGNFHNIIAPNTFYRIFPDGQVLYSTRITLTLSCPMDLKRYPMDRQRCSLLIASYAHTTDDIVFLWKDIDPVQNYRRMHLPNYVLMKFITDSCNSLTNTGEYSCLKMVLCFERVISYYFLSIYIPCTMLVIVAWLSFWLDRNALAARITLAILTLYMMSSGATKVNQSLPPVSYTKAIDVWTGWCITFVFSALMESVLVNYFSQCDMPCLQMNMPCLNMKRNRHQGGPEHLEEADKALDVNTSAEKHEVISKFNGCGRKIDIVSRIAYPIAFVLFNIVYWSTYLSRDDEDYYY